MSGHVYSKSEIVGTSEVSVSDAIGSAIERASKTLRNVEWFEVGEIRGHVKDGKVFQYQVVLKVGFQLEE